MIYKFLLWALLKVNGDNETLSIIFAERVILGKMGFVDVPNGLKRHVQEHLIDGGVSFLTDGQNPSQK